VLDAYSRKVVRWSMANYLRIELVLDALNMAIHNRCSAPGLVNHSDRSTEKYTSVEVGSRVKEAELLPSTDPVVDALDNALAESFVSALKREVLHRDSKPSRESVRVGIFEYIRCFYNPRRRHSSEGVPNPGRLRAS
jgi:putative transposase